MAWEQRGGRRYYYESVWADGGSRRRYLGSGDRAIAAEKAVAERARQLHEDRQDAERFVAAVDTHNKQFKQLHELTKLLFEARLLADGFYLASYTWRTRMKRNEHFNQNQEISQVCDAKVEDQQVQPKEGI